MHQSFTIQIPRCHFYDVVHSIDFKKQGGYYSFILVRSGRAALASFTPLHARIAVCASARSLAAMVLGTQDARHNGNCTIGNESTARMQELSRVNIKKLVELQNARSVSAIRVYTAYMTSRYEITSREQRYVHTTKIIH